MRESQLTSSSLPLILPGAASNPVPVARAAKIPLRVLVRRQPLSGTALLGHDTGDFDSPSGPFVMGGNSFSLVIILAPLQTLYAQAVGLPVRLSYAVSEAVSDDDLAYTLEHAAGSVLRDSNLLSVTLLPNAGTSLPSSLIAKAPLDAPLRITVRAAADPVFIAIDSVPLSTLSTAQAQAYELSAGTQDTFMLAPRQCIYGAHGTFGAPAVTVISVHRTQFSDVFNSTDRMSPEFRRNAAAFWR